MNTETKYDVIFQHLIDLPLSKCVFAATTDRRSGRKQLFLFEHDNDLVFKRNSLRDSWDELKEEEVARPLRNEFIEEIRHRRIPCFQATDLDVFNRFV